MAEQSIIIAGFGGQGVLLGGIVLANAFMMNDKKVTWYPCYGAEMRGGAVNCEVVVSDDEVTSVHKKECDFLIALNDLSFNKFISRVKKGGTVIANESMIKKIQPREDINYIFEKISDIAKNVGSIKATNMVSLGILSTVCKFANLQALEKGLDKVLSPDKISLRELDIKALEAGCNYNNLLEV